MSAVLRVTTPVPPANATPVNKEATTEKATARVIAFIFRTPHLIKKLSMVRCPKHSNQVRCASMSSPFHWLLGRKHGLTIDGALARRKTTFGTTLMLNTHDSVEHPSVRHSEL